MSTTTTQTNEPTTEATADEATILARVDEALAVHPLPKPRKVHAQAVRTYAGIAMSPEVRASLSPLPPALHLYWRTGPEMRAWAAHFGLPLQVRVATYDGGICRTVNAHGTWLGWSVWLAADEEQYRNITPAPVASIVRRAHLGVL